MVKKSEIYQIRLDGGRWCLDLVNTIHNRYEKPPSDYLSGIEDVIVWAHYASVIDDPVKNLLVKKWKNHSEMGQSYFQEVLHMREVFYRLFLCVINQKQASEELKQFNIILKRYWGNYQVQKIGHEYQESWDFPEDSFYQISAPVLKDAHDLLIYGQPERLRECPECGWLFYDTSKSGRRKWCSMETCGSRHKAKQWYKRQKR